MVVYGSVIMTAQTETSFHKFNILIKNEVIKLFANAFLNVVDVREKVPG